MSKHPFFSNTDLRNAILHPIPPSTQPRFPASKVFKMLPQNVITNPLLPNNLDKNFLSFALNGLFAFKSIFPSGDE